MRALDRNHRVDSYRPVMSPCPPTSEDLVAALQARCSWDFGTWRPRFVLQHGKPFTPTDRPKGMRQRKAQHCYRNAGTHVINRPDASAYVEGYAMGADGLCFEHAWITLDGVHAIDPTLPDAQSYAYFGIQFSPAALAAAALASRQYGFLFAGITAEVVALLGGSAGEAPADDGPPPFPGSPWRSRVSETVRHGTVPDMVRSRHQVEPPRAGALPKAEESSRDGRILG